MKRQLLTVEDLLKFCTEHNFCNFSSKETGYKLSVQIPAQFEIVEDTNDPRRGLMKVKVKIFHTGLNRNGSYVSEEAAKNAMPSIKNRPVLGAIHQLDDGSWDFESHNIEIVTNSNGEQEVEYIETQIGSFSEEEPFFEYDEENQKNFVCAYAWIPEEYTKAAEILRQKNGTKNSCELTIDELSYNAKEKYLDLISFYVEGSTFLGSRNDGEEIGEGMLGSRADIVDFSKESNSSLKSDYTNKKIIEVLEKLTQTLSDFNKWKGGKENVSKFDELLTKYSVSKEEITFDYENLTNEELEKKFEENFGEGEAESSEEENEGVSIEEPESENVSENFDEPEGSEGENLEPEMVTNEVFQKVFEISHEDIRYALYQLLAPYEEADNDWYYIIGVYDDHFAYENWSGGVIYGQKYTKNNDNVEFEGERYNLHRELLTDSEYQELQSMRSNYSSIKAELEKYQTKEEQIKKDALFESKDYLAIADKSEFLELMNKHDEYSLEELTSKLDNMLLSYAKTGELKQFDESKSNKKVSKKDFTNPAEKRSKSRYGNLFKK